MKKDCDATLVEVSMNIVDGTLALMACMNKNKSWLKRNSFPIFQFLFLFYQQFFMVKQQNF
jgi:hypothetical protein